MSDMIPFESGQLPAYLQGTAEKNNALTQGVTGGFPILSIKGKAFTLVSGDNRSIITKPDEPDEPASSIQVVIVDANPNLSKTYYEGEYTEGSNAKPACASDDGKTPLPDVPEPQAKSCAMCPRNVWGSGKNGRGKACQDARRIAVAPVGQMNEPMLLRVPPASLRPLKDYGTMLAKRGVSFDAVVTKLRFEPSEATPKLIFQPVRFLTEDEYAELQEVKADPQVDQITGVAPAPLAESVPVDDPAPKAKKAAKPEPEAEPEPTPKPKKAKKKAEPVEEVVEAEAEDEDELDALLAGFDD